MEFNVDDRVYYTAGSYGDTHSNPLRGGNYSCKGTVYLTDRYNVSVKWDNGDNNTYSAKDLEIICALESTNPNISWKRRK